MTRTSNSTQLAAALTTALLSVWLAVPPLSAQYPTSSPTPPNPATTKPATIAPPPISRTILLDPGHGGPEAGATIAGGTLEKDVTRAFAARLRSLLASTFNVATTRDLDSDSLSAPLTSDQRATIANRNPHPLACILLHATPNGSGVHISLSSLSPNDAPADPKAILSWNSAQAASLPQSLRLANDLGVAFQHAHLPVIIVPASIRPIDNLTCPAIALELAPLVNGSSSTPSSDPVYQQHVAEAVSSALLLFRDQTAAIPGPARKPRTSGTSLTPDQQRPAPRPRPATTIPGSVTPAPIVRRPPPSGASSPPPGAPR